MSADLPPSLDAVYQGIHTFYNDPQPQVKEKAGKWLEQLQKSVSTSKEWLFYSRLPTHSHLVVHALPSRSSTIPANLDV